MAAPAQVDHADTWEKVLFLFLGWLLATLSPVIADAVRRRREVRETKGALFSELAELKYRFAIVVHLVESEYGRLDRGLLNWLLPIVAEYNGPLPQEGLAKVIEQMTTFSDEQIAALAAQRKAGPGKALSLKRYPAPFLESRLKVLTWLPDDVQRLMIEIHTQLSVIDSELENIQFYFRLTFDGALDAGNRALVNANLASGYMNYSKTARNIVQRIQELESAWK